MKIKNYKGKFATLFIFIILSSLYLFKLTSSFSVNTDFGRDIFEIQKIIFGKLTLIGPMLSTGFYTSPLYFYFFAPILAIFPFSPISIVIANAIIFSLGFSAIYFLLSKKIPYLFSYFFILAVGILPQTIYSARYPGNGFSYLPFLLCVILYPLITEVTTKKQLLFLGIINFICLSFHPISAFGIVPLDLWLIFQNKNKLRKLIYYTIPSFSFILPVAIFEIKHNFIISRNFLNHSISNTPNILNNFNFINQTISNNFSPFIIIFTIIAIYNFRKHNNLYSSYEKILTKWTAISYLILCIILPKNEWHYLIPFNLLLIVSICISFLKTKKPTIYIAALTIVIFLNFPHNLYTKSIRPLSRFEDAATFIAKKYSNLKTNIFNIIQISDENVSVPVGHEYRYFLKKFGLTPLPETDYSSNSTMIIFSEVPQFDISTLDNWEYNQFGNSIKRIQHDKTKNLDIYVLNK